MITPKESRWPDLFDAAMEIINTVNEDNPVLTNWSFGGGTAMMLQIQHRESYDIDLFLDDPQRLAFVISAVSDMGFALGDAEYRGDGTRSLKIAFSERNANSSDGQQARAIGEIDFIVAPQLTDNPAKQQHIRGYPIQIETVQEIITKKIVYRGSHIQPRDVFDIAAALDAGHKEDIKRALLDFPKEREKAKDVLSKLSQEYVQSVIAGLDLRDNFKRVSEQAYDTTLSFLSEFKGQPG